jgi:hypothetical protein
MADEQPQLMCIIIMPTSEGPGFLGPTPRKKRSAWALTYDANPQTGLSPMANQSEMSDRGVMSRCEISSKSF